MVDTLTRGSLPPIELGSVASQVLADVWSGIPSVVVKSPPGAGKSTLLVQVSSWLADQADLSVVIACQTIAQSIDLASRFASASPDSDVTLVMASKSERPAALPPAIEFSDRLASAGDATGIQVTTLAKVTWSRTQEPFDVLLVDEAWQATWGSFAAAMPAATQTLLVGDPGQIAPVVTGNQVRYRSMQVAPYMPAPDALLLMQPDSHVRQFTLPDTWRCGLDTVQVIAPLYDFAFGSRRPDRFLSMGGERQGELASLTVKGSGGQDDPAVADAIAARVADVIANGTLTDPGGAVRPVTPADVGVVVAHHVQIAAVESRLSDIGASEATVTTTEQHQGQEYPVVIVWSPMAAKVTLNPGFDLDLGRLCVALSRHSHHVTFVERHDTRAIVAQHAGELDEAARGRLLDTLARLTDVADLVPAA